MKYVFVREAAVSNTRTCVSSQSAAPRFSTSVFGVWKCDQMFDMLHHNRLQICPSNRLYPAQTLYRVINWSLYMQPVLKFLEFFSDRVI